MPSAIILLSDGKSVRGRPPTQIAQRAKELKIPIYTVTLGTAAGTINVHAPRRHDGDAARAARPGREPGGRADLRRARLHRRHREGAQHRLRALGSRIGYRDEKREITAAFSGGALALLAAGALLSLHWFRRLV